MNEYGRCSKIVFVGPVGVGKSTAVQHLSDIPVVSTDVLSSDVALRAKQTTTVAMDYGKVTLRSGRIIHLYGTPGQERFSFMWDILTTGSTTAIVLLIDNTRPQPLRDMEFFINSFRRFADSGRMAVAVTHTDVSVSPTLLEYSSELKLLGVDVPLFNVDPRRREAVASLLDMLHCWCE